MYYSVFVNESTGALSASSLKKGHAIKVIGTAKIRIEKDIDGYNMYIIDRISASFIDTDPFKLLSETDNIASDEDVTDIPLE